ncbi:MAG TPA: hypothetical protein DCZ94_05495 [Lentisphaeria bacterium]|nr:MAG: hypothetical protein A2X48_14840 [Lentisphaerae bacterium GWF2_49_21]HBC86391.1 hypothetical protein [Lentisphaeria bacterium]
MKIRKSKLMKFRADVRGSMPLYAQLEQFFISEIRKGVYKPETPLPSIAEIDDRISLGRVTIVRTMQELVKDGFATGIHGKGYYVTHRGEKALIGIVAPFNTVYMQIYVHLAAGVRNAADKLDHEVIIMSSDEDPRKFIQAVNEFINYRGSRWLVLVPPMDLQEKMFPEPMKLLDKIKRLKDIRIAIIDRSMADGVFQVRQDRLAGNLLLLRRAAEKKCRKVLFLNRYMDKWESKDEKLFSTLVREAVDIDPDMKLSFKSAGTAEEDMKFILREKIDAVLTDDIYARRLVNISGPRRQFYVSGYNGMAVATGINPRITTVNSNLAEAGQIAVDYLFEKREFDGNIFEVKPFLVEGETF